MDSKSSVHVGSGEDFVCKMGDCGMKTSMFINTAIQPAELGTPATWFLSLQLKSGEQFRLLEKYSVDPLKNLRLAT